MKSKRNIVKASKIVDQIYEVNGEMVMIDADLADMYGIDTKRLNEQVKRNIDRFPKDFMFKISLEEFKNLKSQNATSSWGGRRTPPNAFTKMGVFMLANVIKSDMAVKTSIQVIRGFVKFRELLSSPLTRTEQKSFNSLIETLKEIEKSPTQAGTVNQNFFITSGKQSPIIIGDNAMVQIANKVKKGDLNALKKGLKNIEVSETEIQELVEILNSEAHPSTNGSYGKKTKAWMKKMMGKAVEGSWQVGIELAGALLAQLLNGYLGI